MPARDTQGGQLSRGLETLEARFQAWADLRAEHALIRARLSDERARLTQQAEFLVGAVRHAGGASPTPDATAPDATLAATGELDRFLAEAEAKLTAAREALDARVAEEEKRFSDRSEEIRRTISEQIARTLERVKPKLQLRVRQLAGGKAILHLDRVRPDEAVLLPVLLVGKLPTRYDFLFDDSTDELALPPPPLYGEEGVTGVRPDAQQLKALVESPAPALPLKGFVPVLLPKPDGTRELYRLLQRGAVMEVEREDGASFRNVLTRDESERFAGMLLRLQLTRRIELEITAG